MSVNTRLLFYLLLVVLLAGCHTTTDRERYGVPADKRIFEKYYFDFNRDGVRDVLLVVEDSAIIEDAKRHLWIFAGQGDSSLRRVVTNEKALPCAICTELGDSTLTDMVVTDTSITYKQTVHTKHDRYETKRFRFEYTNYRKWHLVAVDYTLDCTDAGGEVLPGCVTAMKFRLDAQDILPPVYLDDFNIYDFSPLQIYGNSEKINNATIDFDVDRGEFYGLIGYFPDNLVLQNDSDKGNGMNWMFIFDKEKWPVRTMGVPVDFNKIDLSQFDRYVVSLDREYVDISEDEEGIMTRGPQFPCRATIYHFNNGTKIWDVLFRNRSFSNTQQIAEFVNSLHQ